MSGRPDGPPDLQAPRELTRTGEESSCALPGGTSAATAAGAASPLVIPAATSEEATAAARAAAAAAFPDEARELAAGPVRPCVRSGTLHDASPHKWRPRWRIKQSHLETCLPTEFCVSGRFADGGTCSKR